MTDNRYWYNAGYTSYPNRHNYPTSVTDETMWLKGWHDRRAEMTVDFGPDHVSEGNGQITWPYLEA